MARDGIELPRRGFSGLRLVPFSVLAGSARIDVIIVIADTSGLLAALDSTHPEHVAAYEAIMAAGLLVMSPLLLAELDHVAMRELGRDAAVSAVDDLRRWMSRGRVVMPEITERPLGRHKYSGPARRPAAVTRASGHRSWRPAAGTARSACPHAPGGLKTAG